MITILQNLNYTAPYPGNLMRSLFYLEDLCKDSYRTIYLFPKKAKQIDWIMKMINDGHIVYFKSENSYEFVTLLNNLTQEFNIKIIHNHFYSVAEYKAMKKYLNKEVKLILHHHNHFIDINQTRKDKIDIVFFLKNIYRKYKKMQYKKIIDSDVNIACGYDVEKDLNKNNFKNVVCVENAIDFSRLDIESVKNKSEYGMEEKDKVILIFGFAFERKGVDIALKSIDKIFAEYNIKLCIVFAANENIGKHKIRKMYGEIPDWVCFLEPNNNIAEYYHMSNVFLSPSREEGFCYSIIEAAYCGCDLIFSDISGQMHAQDIPYKYIVKNDSPDELKKAIIKALNSPITKDEKLINKNHIIQRYSLRNWGEKIIDIYNGIL